jgi:TolA-binding protein
VQFIKGNSARAREYLKRVMREYPDSSAARLASDFIDQNL